MAGAKKKKTTEQDRKLGRRIQKVRKERGFTQETLAEAIGVSTTWVGYIETGYRRPSLKLLYKIAKVVRVKVKDVLPF